jgi:glyceraldehyde 3-phosphate dehydrogenase
MTVNIAINGFGRIGRLALRALYESERTNEIRVVAINDLGDARTNAQLLKHDSVHGSFSSKVSVDGNNIVVDNDVVQVFNERDPSKLPWAKLEVHVVLECTGLFRTREKAMMHIKAGAKKVLLSAPAHDSVDATVVYGVNHGLLSSDHEIVSNASCTTNCLAPLVKPLHENIGLVSGSMTVIHAYTNDQALTDVYHKDIRRARSATMSMIPTKTGAATAVGLVLPELAGKLYGFAVRVPIINVSMIDLTFLAARDTSIDEINEVLRKASSGGPSGILEYCDELLVSVDFNHNPASCIYDASLTNVNGGKLVTVCAWFDNEWGFSNRMLDTALALANAS